MFVNNFSIYNKAITAADTEVSQQLTQYASFFEIRCREVVDLKVSFTAGESGTNYFTVPGGSTWYTKGKIPHTVTLYFQCAIPNVTVEILEAF